MRIALFHNLPSGGAKRHTFEQVRRLARRGHDIVEFVPSTADLGFCSLAPYVQSQRVFDSHREKRLSRRIPFVTPYLHAIQGARALSNTDRLNRLIAEKIDEEKFDLVLVKDCRIVAHPYVLRYLGTPNVFQCHHSWHGYPRSNGSSRSNINGSITLRLKRAYYLPSTIMFHKKLESDARTNIRAASLVITNSRFSERRMFDNYRVRACAVYPGIDINVFRPTPDTKADYVLSVGSLVRSKGYRFLISAISRIPKNRRPKLLIAAITTDPDEESIIRQMASRLGVLVQVEHVKDDERLVELYNRARCFVYAPHQEALGMAPLEAMACGSPVVAVNEGGIRETVLDDVTGYLVDRDPAEFADRVEALLLSSPARESMGDAGIDYVRRNWTWEGAVDNLEEKLTTLVSQ